MERLKFMTELLATMHHVTCNTQRDKLHGYENDPPLSTSLMLASAVAIRVSKVLLMPSSIVGF